MRKHFYTKIKKVFQGSKDLYLQMTDAAAYIGTKHLVIRVHECVYRDEFHTADAARFAALQPGDRLTIKNGVVIYDGPELEDMFYNITKTYDPRCEYRLASAGSKEVIKGQPASVRFLDNGHSEKTLLNNKYYEALEQATRGGSMYTSGMIKPVLFYDNPDICASMFVGCVLPINYRVLEKLAA